MEGNPQELVSKSLEPFVVEIYKQEQFAAISHTLNGDCTRIDESTGIVRVYSCDEAGLRDLTRQLKPGDFFFRQSNLEDLFLKITGSALNEQQ